MLQLPSAIIHARLAIVSQEAKVNSAIISGSGGAARRRLRFFIVAGCRGSLRRSAMSFLLRRAGACHRRPARRIARRKALLGLPVDEFAVHLGAAWAQRSGAPFPLLLSIRRGLCCHRFHLCLLVN